jgi:hypothetical protein
MTAAEIIRLLGLVPLPGEGGYYRETYRSRARIDVACLPSGYTGSRAISTAIYYLLTPDTFSAMHRLPGDEVYHFYFGDPVEMLQLEEDGSGEVVILGHGLGEGMRPQVVVSGGAWQGSSLAAGGRYALLGTTMAPGFDFEDFVAGNRDELCRQYPQFAEKIVRLTRN